MANKLFGEARLTTEDGRELTLRFDFNALVEAEEAADESTEIMMKVMASGKPRLRIARAMLFGALRYHHPTLTLEDAGELFMSDSEKVSAAMGSAMEEMAVRKAGGNPPPGTSPKKASSPGTGTSSSKRGRKQG